jgi:hypothetical protein
LHVLHTGHSKEEVTKEVRDGPAEARCGWGVRRRVGKAVRWREVVRCSAVGGGGTSAARSCFRCWAERTVEKEPPDCVARLRSAKISGSVETEVSVMLASARAQKGRERES